MLEQKKQRQVMRFTDIELEFIKNTFKGNYELIILIRRFLLQGCSEEELKTLSSMITPEAIRILRKIFIPEVDPKAPLGQLIDFWMTIDVKGKTIEQSALAMETIQLVDDYLNQRFRALPTGADSYGDIKLKDLVYNKNEGARQNHINLGARNTIIDQIEVNSNEIDRLANREEETEKEIRERQGKNSSK